MVEVVYGGIREKDVYESPGFRRAKYERYGFDERCIYYIKLPEEYNYHSCKEKILSSVVNDKESPRRHWMHCEESAQQLEKEINEFIEKNKKIENKKVCENCRYYVQDSPSRGCCESGKLIDLHSFDGDKIPGYSLIAYCTETHDDDEYEDYDGIRILVHRLFGCVNWKAVW